LCGVIFMWRRLRFELSVLQKYIVFLIGISFLTAFGGILLWVNGSAAPIVFRATAMPSCAPGFTFCFIIWLIIYALSGLKIGCTIIPTVIYRCSCFQNITGECLSFILLLAWYPLFFSVVHAFFAAFVLFIYSVLQIVMLFAHSRKFLISLPLTILLVSASLYFLLITVIHAAIN